MQRLGTDRAFVEEQYSDADKLRIRIETHARYSQDETERILNEGVDALLLSSGLRVLDVGCTMMDLASSENAVNNQRRPDRLLARKRRGSATFQHAARTECG